MIIGGGSYDVSATKRGSQSVARSRNIQHPHMSDFKMLSQNMPFLFYIFSHIRKKRPHSSSQSAVPVVVRTVKDHVPTRCSTSICTDVTEEFRLSTEFSMDSGRILKLWQNSLSFHQGIHGCYHVIGTMIIISMPSKTRPKVKSLRQALTSEEFHTLRHLKLSALVETLLGRHPLWFSST